MKSLSRSRARRRELKNHVGTEAIALEMVAFLEGIDGSAALAGDLPKRVALLNRVGVVRLENFFRLLRGRKSFAERGRGPLPDAIRPWTYEDLFGKGFKKRGLRRVEVEEKKNLLIGESLRGKVSIRFNEDARRSEEHTSEL